MERVQIGTGPMEVTDVSRYIGAVLPVNLSDIISPMIIFNGTVFPTLRKNSLTPPIYGLAVLIPVTVDITPLTKIAISIDSVIPAVLCKIVAL